MGDDGGLPNPGRRQREKGLAVPGSSGRTGEAQVKSAIGVSSTNSLPKNPWIPDTSRIPIADGSTALPPPGTDYLGEEQWAPALFHSHFQEAAGRQGGALGWPSVAIPWSDMDLGREIRARI